METIMTPEERQLLAGLFDRTRAASANPRDKEAEAFIAEALREQPYATYLLAQAVIVQDQALGAANEKLQQLEARVKELEAAQASSGGSFLGGLFGGGRPAAPTSVPSAGAAPVASPSPWGRQQNPAPAVQQGGAPQYAQPSPWQGQPQQGGMPGVGGGGGFLKGALGAAAGVAGGMLLANSISSLFNQHGNNSLGIGSGFGGADPTGGVFGQSYDQVAGPDDGGGLMGGIFPDTGSGSDYDDEPRSSGGFFDSSDDTTDV
jgi:hypothetical protein